MDVKFVVAVVATGLAIVLDIVGLAIPYWNSENSGNMGLWSVCTNTPVNICVSISDVGLLSSSLKATRAMVILGLLLATAAIVSFLLRQCLLKEKFVLNKVAGVLAVLAGILILVGVVIYGTDAVTKHSLSAGFILTTVSAVFAIVGGVFMFIVPTDPI